MPTVTQLTQIIDLRLVQRASEAQSLTPAMIVTNTMLTPIVRPRLFTIVNPDC